MYIINSSIFNAHRVGVRHSKQQHLRQQQGQQKQQHLQGQKHDEAHPCPSSTRIITHTVSSSSSSVSILNSITFALILLLCSFEVSTAQKVIPLSTPDLLECNFTLHPDHGCPSTVKGLGCDKSSKYCVCIPGYQFHLDSSLCLDNYGCEQDYFWHNLIEKCIKDRSDEAYGAGLGMGIGVFLVLMLAILIIRSARFCVKRAAYNYQIDDEADGNALKISGHQFSRCSSGNRNQNTQQQQLQEHTEEQAQHHSHSHNHNHNHNHSHNHSHHHHHSAAQSETGDCFKPGDTSIVISSVSSSSTGNSFDQMFTPGQTKDHRAQEQLSCGTSVRDRSPDQSRAPLTVR